MTACRSEVFGKIFDVYIAHKTITEKIAQKRLK